MRQGGMFLWCFFKAIKEDKKVFDPGKNQCAHFEGLIKNNFFLWQLFFEVKGRYLEIFADRKHSARFRKSQKSTTHHSTLPGRHLGHYASEYSKYALHIFLHTHMALYTIQYIQFIYII